MTQPLNLRRLKAFWILWVRGIAEAMSDTSREVWTEY